MTSYSEDRTLVKIIYALFLARMGVRPTLRDEHLKGNSGLTLKWHYRPGSASTLNGFKGLAR